MFHIMEMINQLLGTHSHRVFYFLESPGKHGFGDKLILAHSALRFQWPPRFRSSVEISSHKLSVCLNFLSLEDEYFFFLRPNQVSYFSL